MRHFNGIVGGEITITAVDDVIRIFMITKQQQKTYKSRLGLRESSNTTNYCESGFGVLFKS